MADERVVNSVKIVDPTTTSQEAAVDASGHLQVDIAASSVALDTELPAAAALTDNFANPTAPGVGSFGMLWDGVTWDRAAGNSVDGALVNLGANNDVTVTGAVDTELPAAAALADNMVNPTVPAVGAFAMVFDGTNWDRLQGTTADGALVNLGTNNDVTITGAVDTELPAAAALADGAANPTVPAVGSHLMGFDGTLWDRVYVVADGDAVAAATKGFLQFGSDGVNYQAITTDASGHLQVDVLTGGGTDSPTNPTVNLANSTDTAAGSSSNLDTAEITEAEKIWLILVTASVAFKAVIQRVENGAATAIGTLFGRAGQTVEFRPPHRDFTTHAGSSAGLDVFRVVCTNLDTSQAADLYGSFYYST